MADMLRLALIQDNPVTGNIALNTARAIKLVEAHADADLVVFSECYVTGYPIQDLALRPGFIAEVESAIQELRKAVVKLRGPAMLIGAPQAGATLPYNAAYLIEPTGAIRVVHKSELPNEDVFDERRTFAMSNDPRPKPLRFRGFNLGIQICEDMWHGDVSRSLAAEMADVLIAINGSPYQGGKQAQRKAHAAARVRTAQVPLIYVNQVGGQDELVFDGASFTMNTDGATMTARAFAPDVMRIRLRRAGPGAHIEMDGEVQDHPYPASELQADYQACVLGLRDYIGKTGSSHVFIGISGGLDSALVATMAADAIGAESVYGVMMPSRHTGSESLGLADDLMARLGINAHVIPIGEAFAVVDSVMTGHSEAIAQAACLTSRVKAGMELARENYQARLRGMFLMGLSNALGGIVLSTGNKSEMAVGYSTLYGDMAGGYNPLKSVWKSEAFEMARWRNSIEPREFGFMGERNPIPPGIIDRPPTAELSEGQTDAASLGDYAALDTVLKALIEQRQDPGAATLTLAAAFPDREELERLTGERTAYDYVRRIAGLVRRAQYKRVQAPPGVKLQETDFGAGWRYPIAGRYSL